MPRTGAPFGELVGLEIQFQVQIPFNLKPSVSLEKEGQVWSALGKEIAIYNQEIFFKATIEKTTQRKATLEIPLCLIKKYSN